MANFGIIVAGGKGKRMGKDTNKCLLPLAGKEILIRSTEKLIYSKIIDKIVIIVGSEEEVNITNRLLNKYNLKENILAVSKTAGEERQDGVKKGLEIISKAKPKKKDIILIHNGANPLVSVREIAATIEEAKKYGAAAVALPVRDTIKRVIRNIVTETIDRKNLWSMQTPQAIRFDLAVNAFKKAYKDAFYGTDDVQLVERMGKEIKIVKASPYNFKITTSEDMKLAKILIEEGLLEDND